MNILVSTTIIMTYVFVIFKPTKRGNVCKPISANSWVLNKWFIMHTSDLTPNYDNRNMTTQSVSLCVLCYQMLYWFNPGKHMLVSSHRVSSREQNISSQSVTLKLYCQFSMKTLRSMHSGICTVEYVALCHMLIDSPLGCKSVILYTSQHQRASCFCLSSIVCVGYS